MAANNYDVIVIGAGHNGLVTATYLAKAGQKVLLVEAGEQPGGAAQTREFAKGYRVSAVAHLLHALHPKIIADLVERGAFAQLDAGSLTKSFGPESYQSAKKILEAGLAHFIATDAHHQDRRRPILSAAVAVAAGLVGEEYARALVGRLSACSAPVTRSRSHCAACRGVSSSIIRTTPARRRPRSGA